MKTIQVIIIVGKFFFFYLEENKQVDDFMSDNLFKNVKFRYEEVFSPLFFES